MFSDELLSDMRAAVNSCVAGGDSVGEAVCVVLGDYGVPYSLEAYDELYSQCVGE